MRIHPLTPTVVILFACSVGTGIVNILKARRHAVELKKAQEETRAWRARARAAPPARLFAIRMERGWCPKLLSFGGKVEGERWHEYSVEYSHRYGTGGYRFLVDGLQPPVVVYPEDGKCEQQGEVHGSPAHYWIWNMTDWAAGSIPWMRYYGDLDPVEYAGWVGLDELIWNRYE